MEKPVEIAAMPNAGISKDGQLAFFDFDCHDGVTYKFKVTHQAVPTIVENLIKCAEASERTLSGLPVTENILKAQSFKASSVHLVVTPDGSRIGLRASTPGRMAVALELDAGQCARLGAELLELSSRLAPPQDSKQPN